MKSITNISIIRHFRTSCKALPEIFPFRRENRSSFRHSAEKHSGAKGKHIAAVPRPWYPLKTSGATSKWPFRTTTPSICIWRCSGFSKRCFSSRWRSFSTRWKWRNTSAGTERQRRPAEPLMRRRTWTNRKSRNSSAGFGGTFGKRRIPDRSKRRHGRPFIGRPCRFPFRTIPPAAS